MLCPIGQSNEKPPLQALAKWREYVTQAISFIIHTLDKQDLIFINSTHPKPRKITVTAVFLQNFSFQIFVLMNLIMPHNEMPSLIRGLPNA